MESFFLFSFFLSFCLPDSPLIFPLINLPLLRGWHLCPGMFILTLLFFFLISPPDREIKERVDLPC